MCGGKMVKSIDFLFLKMNRAYDMLLCNMDL